MADTRALRGRIKSATSTLHLTKAMGLVASSKIRRASEAMAKAKQYANAYGHAVQLLAACPECAKNPFMQQRNGEKIRLIVIAGDKGMAGGYNANVFRFLTTLPQAEIIPLGKRACDRFGKDVQSSEHFTPLQAAALAKSLCADFAAGEFDALGIVYTEYISMMSQVPTVKWVLPLTKAEGVKNTGAVFEPDENTVLQTVIPGYVSGQIMAAVRESFAAEVTARRMAMDSAGKNAQQMIDDLQLEYNRARQGAITQEITEIVAGSGE